MAIGADQAASEAAPPATPATPTSAAETALLRRGRVRPGVVLLVASLGLFMAFVDDTVVGIAFPNIVRSFPGATLSELSWVLNAYNIALAALIIPMGRFADRFGRRRVYIAGIVLFTLASALSAAAPSIDALIAARALQGAGAAAIIPASLAIVLHAFPAGKRAEAVTFWSATAALAAGVGPSIGGALVDAYNWRLVFLVNLPIGVAVWFLARRQLVQSRAPGRRTTPDLPGALILAVAVGALTLAIAQGPDWGWTDARVAAALLLAVVATAAIVQRARRRSDTVLDTELLRTPRFTVTSGLTVIGSAGFFALGLANVLFLMQVWRYSPLQAGLATTPAPFLAAATAGLAARFVMRFDARRIVAVGAVIWTAGPLFLLARAGTQPDFLGTYLPAAALLAVGVGIAFPLVSDAAVAGAPRGRYAGASAMNGAVRQVGAAVGIAILAALIGSTTATLSLPAFQRAWVFAAVCFAVVAAGALALPRHHTPDLSDEDELARMRDALPPVVRPVRPSRPAAARQPPSWPGWESDEALLAETALFAGLPAAARRALADQCQTVRLPFGEWLFRQGDPADAMYVVRSGRIELISEREGHEPERLHELGRGAVVGELALLTMGGRAASVRSCRDAVLLRLSHEAFETTLQTDSEFALSIARNLASRLQRSRNLEPQAPLVTTTLAVVHGAAAPAGSELESQLLLELRKLRDVAELDRRLVQEQASDAELGVALAQVLDRVQGDHDLVVLAGIPAVRGDAWLACSVRQADRVLLVLEPGSMPVRELPADLLRGCDVVLLGPADRPGMRELLDRLAPRSTHRVRGPDDVARLARRLAGQSVGLVLSGGGARGFAHLGVIEELLAAGITIDRVGGASMGAFVGALLAQGMDVEEMDACCYREWVRRNPLGDYQLPRTALTRGGRMRAMLERHLEGLIEDLPRSFYCVTTDLISAQLVVHRRGRLATAVVASMSVPGVSPAVPLDGGLLVDGAVLDNLPIATMVDEAEGPIIASDVTRPEQRSLAPGERLPEVGLVDTITRCMLLGTSDTRAEGRRHAALFVEPDVETAGRMEFHLLDELRDAGRRAALEALEAASELGSSAFLP